MRGVAGFGAIVLIVVVALSALTTVPAMALPLAPKLGRASLIEAAKRCPPGYRKSTIAAKCVRTQPRWPSLSRIF
jgi:hypothetical protein